MNALTTFAASVLVFGLLIAFHELGHFLLARRAGVRVHEFALGFGPKVVAWRRGETSYALRLLPLGGFVRMAGTSPDEADDPRGFARKTLGQRFSVIVAGPLANFLLAAVLFAVVFAAYGITVPADGTRVGDVLEGYPAAEAGLRPGDRVLSIAGRPVRSWQDLVDIVQANPGRPIVFVVERDGAERSLTVTPRANPQRGGRGFVGMSPEVTVRRLSVPAAAWQGVAHTGRIALLWAESLARMLRGGGGADLAGPVGIIATIGEQARIGLVNVVWLAAVLSANLAFINLLPVPALDGSRLVFLGLEAVRGRPIDPEKENFIHLVGFAMLMLLIMLVTFRDIQRLSPGL